MSFLTIDDLIGDVNRVARLTQIEELRSPCVRYVHQVYRKIGCDELKVWFEELFPVENMTLQLPSGLSKLEDVLITPAGYEDFHAHCYIGAYQQMGSLPSLTRPMYRREQDKLRFFHPGIKQAIIVYQTYPIDANGELLIDDRIYDACVNYACGQELRVKFSNQRQERSTMNPAYDYDRQALREMDRVRAEIHQDGTFPQWREQILQSKLSSPTYRYYATTYQHHQHL